jgi:hypothetical protein
MQQSSVRGFKLRPLVFGIVLATIVASLSAASCKGGEPVLVCVDTTRSSYIGAEIRDWAQTDNTLATDGCGPTAVFLRVSLQRS